LSAYAAHVSIMKRDEQGCQPKHHILFHLLFNMRFFGNARDYATWHDEALNKTLKASCRATSQSTFDRSVLLRMRELLSKDLKRPRDAI
jgi:hypothetical protein